MTQNVLRVPFVNRPTVTVVDTTEVDDGLKLLRGNQAIRSWLSPTRTEQYSASSATEMYFRHLAFGTIEVTECKLSPIRDVRSMEMISKYPNDNFYLMQLMKGSGTLTQCGRQVPMHPGDAVLYDSAREFSWQADEHFEVLVLRLPRQIITKRVSNAEELVAKPIQSDSPFSSMLRGVITSAMAISEFDREFDVAKYCRSIIDMVGTCLDLGLERSKSGLKAQTIIGLAKSVLLDNIENDKFGFESLCAELNASSRTICRAFEREGTTAMRWLWGKRLEVAYDLAVEGVGLTVADIAVRCGFTDFSHFSRAFKAKYGSAPSVILKQNQALIRHRV